MAIENRFASESFVTEQTEIVKNQIITVSNNALLKTEQELTGNEIEQIHINLHTTEYVNNILENYIVDIAVLLGGIE